MGTTALVDILVVDDDLEIRSLMNEILSDLDYDVRAFENGDLALAYLQEQPRVGLIILDIVMRPHSGLEFLARKQAQPALRDIPVLVCSGFERYQWKPLPGASQVLMKPFQLEDLLGAVRRFVPLTASTGSCTP